MMFSGKGSIRRKIRWALFATGGTILLVATVSFMVMELLAFRKTLLNHLEVMSRVVSVNITPALEFNDPKTASEFIASLKAYPSIVTVTIYDGAGHIFAHYSQQNAEARNLSHPRHGESFSLSLGRGQTEIFKPIMSGQSVLGYLNIQADFREFDEYFKQMLWVIFAILLLSGLVGVLISRRFQGVISNPILSLYDGVRALTSRDFSKRVPVSSQDELGELAVAFNEMLSVLEQTTVSKGHLEKAYTELEKIKDSLAKKTEALTRSNKELEQFAYVASHDLQEPLRMVASYVELLARRYKSKLDKDADEFIAYAVDGANRMKGLIQDLLTFSRVGTRGGVFASVDCNEVLGIVLNDLKMVIEETHVSVIQDLQDNHLPVVIADGQQLVQVIENLVLNAIKFRSEKDPYVRISVKQEAEGWLFAVKDNGIGIKSEYFERIFVIFQRLHSREKYAGTGIGLAVCKRIVERHRGKIWVESEEGKGSTFYFSIPFNLGGEDGATTENI